MIKSAYLKLLLFLKLKKIIFFLCFSLILFPLHTNVKTLPSIFNAKTSNFDELDSLITIQKQLSTNSSKGFGHKFKLANLLMKKGAWEEAEKLIWKIISADQFNYKANFLLGIICKRTFRLNAADSIFNVLLKKDSNCLDVKIEIVKLKIIKQDIKSAAALLDEILDNEPNHVEAICQQAVIEYLKSNDQNAKEIYKKAARIDQKNSAANYGIANILFNESKFDSAKIFVDRAIQFDFFNSNAHTLLGYLYFKEGKIIEAGNEIRLSLKCDNYNSFAHKIYGQGVTDKNYTLYPKIEDFKKTNYKLWKKIDYGNQFINMKKYSDAKKVYYAILHEYPTNIFACLSLGHIYWITNELDSALMAYVKILDNYPNYGTAHNGFYRVAATKIDNFNIFTKETSFFFDQLLFPVPANLKDIFINFSELSKKFQSAILFSIKPLANFFPALKAAGATFYILPLHEKLTDDKHRIFLKNTHTFDNRLWDDVRGNGGLHATACIGSVWDVTKFKFNEIAHEFAHQVHIYTLTEKEKGQIKKLYNSALLEKICLDKYAASDEFEYFAVGVEAYISEVKRMDQKGYHGHTKEELRKKDPNLLDFIKKLSRKKDISANIQAAKNYKANN